MDWTVFSVEARRLYEALGDRIKGSGETCIWRIVIGDVQDVLSLIVTLCHSACSDILNMGPDQ